MRVHNNLRISDAVVVHWGNVAICVHIVGEFCNWWR